jgi:thiol-disulfide isomerase/thioredoxin
MRNVSSGSLLSAFLLSVATCVGCAESDAPATGSQSGKQEANNVAGADGTTAESGDAGESKPMSLDEPAESADDPSELVVGDKAPAIAISKWIKGEPITAFKSDTVHVVEFWATWCGPCLASMPHMASLQTEYGDKVAFIGVTAEDEPTITAFMDQTATGKEQKWSELLTYRIALDDNRKTNAAYMEAAGQNGIPCAFIVGKTGLVEWIGHPVEIDEPLKQVVAGKWDSENAKRIAKEAKEVQKALNEIGPKVDEAVSSGDFKTAVELVDGLIKRFPSNTDLPMIRFQCLIGGGMSEDANATAKTLIDAAQDDARKLDQLAWMMATGTEKPGIDLDLALSAAERAVKLSDNKDISAIETTARVQFRKGNVAEAVALQKKTLELAKNPRQVQQLKAGLAKYEAELPASAETPAAAEEAVVEPKAEDAKAEDAESEEAKPEAPAEAEPSAN